MYPSKVSRQDQPLSSGETMHHNESLHHRNPIHQSKALHPVTQSVTKKDHSEKMSGTACFVADHAQDGMLHACAIRSPYTHARVRAVNYPALPEGYCSVDYRDVLGENAVHIVEDDSPVFAADEVCYVGEAVALIVGSLILKTPRGT